MGELARLPDEHSLECFRDEAADEEGQQQSELEPYTPPLPLKVCTQTYAGQAVQPRPGQRVHFQRDLYSRTGHAQLRCKF